MADRNGHDGVVEFEIPAAATDRFAHTSLR